jgi:hypothetical protein
VTTQRAFIGFALVSLLNGCSLLFDVDNLTEGADAGGNADARVVDSAPEVVERASDATSESSRDAASDSSSDSAASDTALDRAAADSGALDSTLEGSGRNDGGSEASTDADAQSEGGRPKCGSKMLMPTTAAASTVLSPNVAAYAIDGLLTTRWETASADPQWIDVDFGAPVFIGEVDVLWEAACAKDYDLEVSMDGTTWTTIPNGTVTGNTLAANPPADNPIPPTDWTKAVVTKPLAAVGRYVRIDGTMRCTAYGYSFWEMRAYGDDNANCVP